MERRRRRRGREAVTGFGDGRTSFLVHGSVVVMCKTRLGQRFSSRVNTNQQELTTQGVFSVFRSSMNSSLLRVCTVSMAVTLTAL